MTRHFLTEMLADLVDDEHLGFATQIDGYLRGRWDANTDTEYDAALAKLENNPPYNASADFIVFILLLETLLDVRAIKGEGGYNYPRLIRYVALQSNVLARLNPELNLLRIDPEKFKLLTEEDKQRIIKTHETQTTCFLNREGIMKIVGGIR